MKKIITLMMLFILTISSNARTLEDIVKNGPWKAKVTFKVLDSQTLKPLPDCKITLKSSVFDKIHKKFIGKTNTEGIYIFEEKVYILNAIFEKENYYNSYAEINFNLSKFDYSKGAIYQPWNQEIVVKLRKK